MRRRRLGIRKGLAWLAIMGSSLLLCLGLSYALSVHHFRDQAQSLAEANAHRVLTVMRQANSALALLAIATKGECSAESIANLNHAVFHGIYFREAGIERDGELRCTNMEILAPGFTIENASRKPAARVGNLEILSPTETIQGGKSLILNWSLRDDRSLFVNLLIDPQVLVDNARYPDGLQTATFLDDIPNGELIRFDADGNSNTSAAALSLSSPLTPGIYSDAEGTYAIAGAEPYQIFTLTSISQAEILRHWRTQMQPAAIIGFALSALAFLVLRRMLPRNDQLQDLREGIAAREIGLSYQPIVDARDHRIVGVEALARWHHPKRGMILPNEFIPLAESSGLITILTEHFLQLVKRDLEVLGELPDGFRVSINLAGAQLVDRSLIAMLDRVFGAQLRLERLAFEITERELLDHVAPHARAIVAELVERGALVSLDDFGTGYSGLSHLRHLSLNHIKIDGSFVHALNTEAVTASLVENIVALAHSLGLGTVAEGVESEPQREKLLALGVHLQQGWLFARALMVDELRAALLVQRGQEAGPGASQALGGSA